MKVSVIILNWNRPTDTVKAAKSVLVQDHPDIELVIWDNASTDNSKTVLESQFGQEPRVHLVFADANYGVAGGRNRAFPLATGDLLLSLDSDAFFDSRDALSLITARVESDTSLGAVSFEVKRPDGHLMWPFSRPAATWRTREFETIRVDGCAFGVRRNVFEAVGGFAEHFSPYGAEDQHFAFRVISAGYRIIYFPTVNVIHTFSMQGRTSEQLAMHMRNMLLIPLELFPMPHGLASAAKLAIGFLHDSCEQHQLSAYFKGLYCAFRGYSAHRHGMSREGWQKFRMLVQEDKALAKSGAAIHSKT